MSRDALIPVTVIVPTKNEEAAIKSCLDAIVPFFGQVLVVDSRSMDRTVDMARELGADTLLFDWDGNYPKKKEWSMRREEVKFSWVLFVDADEIVTPALRREISEVAADGFRHMDAFDVRLEYWWLGQQLRYGQTVTKRVLLRRSRCSFPPLRDLDAPGMGEQEGHYQPTVHGPIGILESKLAHNDPDPLSDWIARHNRYSDWEAYLRIHPAVRADVLKLRSAQGRLLERLPAKPLIIFLYNFLFRRGFLDGRAGFDYALSLAMYHAQIGMKSRDPLHPGNLHPGRREK